MTTDDGHELIFGTFLTPTAEQPDRVVGLAQLTERVGLDFVTVQDHPYQARFLDTWTLLSVVAARTTTLRVAPNVANLPLRLPAVLARSAASLDLLSGGRVELGLGAGAFWDGIAAMGGQRLDGPRAVDALEQGIGVIRRIWDPGARSRPRPAHDIEIWLGAYKPRMLAMTGRLADGWLPSSSYAAPDVLPAMNAAIDEAATAAGRSPADVRRLYNIAGSWSGSGFLQGPPAVWAEQLAELTLTQGISAYFLGSDDADDIRRFAAEVVPAVRELVAAGRRLPPAATPPAATAPAEAALSQPGPRATPSAQRVVPGLGVTPTPDDGTRRSGVRVWDESTRPSGPAPEPQRSYSPQEQAAGRHLVDVHDHLRAELERVHDLVDQVLDGAVPVGAARSDINTMTMRQNNWTVGVYCESYCRVVTGHHSLEDQSVFPHLRLADPRLEPVIDRLEQEHVAIHDVLEGVDRALVAFVTGPEGSDGLRAAMDLLSDTLLSHLSYEERELVEPLARVGFF